MDSKQAQEVIHGDHKSSSFVPPHALQSHLFPDCILLFLGDSHELLAGSHAGESSQQSVESVGLDGQCFLPS